MASSKEDEILVIAESLAREGGYGNFSFREIAKKIGIKSSSVHYYFPTKEQLGATLAKNYRVNFFEKLGEPKTYKHDEALSHLRSMFRDSLLVNKKMCLCGLLGAEIDSLPEVISEEVALFFKDLEKWLIEVFTIGFKYKKRKARSCALREIALLEGSMIIAKAYKDSSTFDLILEHASS
ncbi:MAG: TetR/AcrR family transcriptional regulator [Oligoflexales bacterium]